MGYRIVTNGEFQHHGIMGQKWGVITRNVGVNYIPIGGRGSSAKETASRVLKGAASGATAAGKAVSGAGKAVIRGAKAYKAEREAKKLEKQHSAYRSGKYRLSKKDIANMTDQEVNNAILRRQREEQLYNMEHPQIAAGKDFMSKYVMNAVQSLAGDYTKKFVGMKIDDALRNYIKNNDRYTTEQKIDMLDKLNLMGSSDKIDKAIRDNIKITNHINSRNDLSESQKRALRYKFDVNDYTDDVARAADLWKEATRMELELENYGNTNFEPGSKGQEKFTNPSGFYLKYKKKN